ncbi:MAG: hypothetical protein HQ582_12900, partial [Planctomycetes bacterium]|nr:hypothetical protein [Planctomycetota bacterium]
MMDVENLETAILNKDPDGVVKAMSEWNEQQREEARKPFNIFMLALGFDRDLIQPSDLDRNSPDVVAKRKRDRIVEMSRKDRTIDREMSRIARLGYYGLQGMEDCKRFPSVHGYLPQSAQIMTDRKPPWWKEWYRAVTSGEIRMEPEFWALLYERGMTPADSFGQVAAIFLSGLPGAMASSPQAVQKVMREIEPCRDLVYDAPTNDRQLFCASDWTPVIEWMRGQKLLDASRLLAAVLDALHEPFNQTERNGAVIFAKAVKANGKALAKHQPRWAGLVADAQSSVAGFAVQQLAKIQKAGLLDAEGAIAALPSIFSHKPKGHAKTAVEVLGRIAAEQSPRRPAVEAVTTALMHTNKEVQKAALQVLGEHLHPDDDAAIDSIRLHQPSVAATLASDVEKLLSLAEAPSSENPPPGPSGRKTPSPPTEASDGSEPVEWDGKRFSQSAEDIPPEIRSRLRLDQALEAARRAEIDLTVSWTIRDAKILASAEPIRPIESVEELIDLTAAAVEQCECPDAVDRIVGGIVRLYRQRPKSFDSMTKSLRKRGCAGIFDRPQRGIVAGHLGSSFALLIGAWLGVEQDEDDYLFLGGPVQLYLDELSKRVRVGTATPLLSEATHAGGWIDPRVWVGRLLQAQTDKVELFEEDLVRSLLRLTPDGRDEALRQCESLTSPFRAMATAALGSDVKIDPSWTPQVWITALRARDPWIDLSKQLSREEQAVITDELKRLPDVVYPADYQWSVRERTANTTWLELVEAWP